MKQIVFALTILFLFGTACTDQIAEVQLVDLKDHNMKIIPVKPTSNDQIKLVIFDDCTYNTLSGVTRNGQTIDIQKQFNSMMKWPCMMRNDTIQIGKLPEGTYVVNYKLIDLAPSSGAPASSISFTLVVAR